MSMELGTYSQGEYVPKEIIQQEKTGSTALEFSSLEDVRPPYDTSVIYVVDDPELAPEKDSALDDVQASFVTKGEYFRLLRLRKRKSGRTTKQDRKFR